MEGPKTAFFGQTIAEKLNMKNRAMVFLMVLSAICLCPTGAFAESLASTSQSNPASADSTNATAGLPKPVEPAKRQSVLDEKQRADLRDAFKKHEEEFKRIADRAKSLQAEMGQIILEPKFDEKKVREKAEGLAKLQVEDMMLRAKIFATTISAGLNPEQREQIGISLLSSGMNVPSVRAAPGTGPGAPGIAPGPAATSNAVQPQKPSP